MKKKSKKKLPKCSVCTFTLTGGPAGEGDVCPWCRRGILEINKD